MPTYSVEISTRLNLTVEVDADDEDTADEVASTLADAYAKTIGGWTGDPRVHAEASFDGIGADTVREVVES